MKHHAASALSSFDEVPSSERGTGGIGGFWIQHSALAVS